MQRAEFLKLIGSKGDGDDYIPVACLLRNGFACAGFINQSIVEQYSEVCILVNAQMIDLRDSSRRTEWGAVHDFGDFLEEFVIGLMGKKSKKKEVSSEETEEFQERFGKRIPLTAISFDEIAVVYPVARIGNLLKQANAEAKKSPQQVPSFLDFENKSIVVKVLNMKLW